MTFDKLYLTQYKELTSTRQAQGYGNRHLQSTQQQSSSYSQSLLCTRTSNGTSYTIPCFKTQNLYPIPITPIKISNASHQIHDAGIQNTLKWHLRLGHPHLQALHKIRTHNLANGIIGPFTHLIFCEGCLFGKMTSNPYPRSTQYTTNPLHLSTPIYVDQCRLPPSPELFTFSHFSMTTPSSLSSKRNLTPYPISQPTKIWLKTKKIKILRSDNGGEFNSKEFNNILQSQGILHQRTIPHHPQQNGKAERKNRTLMDVARSMLKTANLPKFLLGRSRGNNLLFTKQIAYDNTPLSNTIQNGQVSNPISLT